MLISKAKSLLLYSIGIHREIYLERELISCPDLIEVKFSSFVFHLYVSYVPFCIERSFTLKEISMYKIYMKEEMLSFPIDQNIALLSFSCFRDAISLARWHRVTIKEYEGKKPNPNNCCECYDTVGREYGMEWKKVVEEAEIWDRKKMYWKWKHSQNCLEIAWKLLEDCHVAWLEDLLQIPQGLYWAVGLQRFWNIRVWGF